MNVGYSFQQTRSSLNFAADCHLGSTTGFHYPLWLGGDPTPFGLSLRATEDAHASKDEIAPWRCQELFRHITPNIQPKAGQSVV